MGISDRQTTGDVDEAWTAEPLSSSMASKAARSSGSSSSVLDGWKDTLRPQRHSSSRTRQFRHRGRAMSPAGD